jgi:hypothetical protein
MVKSTTAWLVWRSILTAEGLALVLIGASGLVSTSRAPGPPLSREPNVLLFQLNPAHSALLLLTGLIAVVAAQRLRSFVWWSAVQMVGFLLLFLWGTAQSTAQETSTPFLFDAAENFLHGGLAALGFVLLIGGVSVRRQTGNRPADELAA